MTIYANTPWNDLTIGMEASVTRLCVADDLIIFANSSGNMNPLHIPDADGDGDGVPEAIAPSAWLGALISGVLGNRLPGPGTLYKSQSLSFHGRARAGEELTARVRLTALGPDREATFDTWIEAADGTTLASGEAKVTAPVAPQSFSAEDVPGLTVRSHVHFDRLIARAEHLPPIPTAVVAPESPEAIAGALLGRDHTLITPILVGNAALIETAAHEAGVSIAGLELIDEPDHDRAARRAVALVHEGRARAVMKGHLHTDVLLRAIVKREGGLRTGRRLSHVFVMDIPGIDHLVLVTDAAINIAPDLTTKIDIVQNAIDLALALGIDQPKAGILSAVETVNPAIPSTLDAAALSKMAERGQITGGLVDGPLAMDNAVDLEAAVTKGIKSLVAGHADILVAPNLESGNMIAKQLTFLAHAEAGGIVVGASVPVILTSRADDEAARLASCAVAALYGAKLP
ncbi:bifunctional enoyl-CoA hydratase/phosphate acetyltransferase [Roseisalinus antarcticus]|uniref:Phosphate acetyltransferase n=1 Tax=Roseisalinus antarcticus TaxID=254357 RepID=A0A1Y5SGJ7_9RHOB|nr:bifunctional enoyl-CoA hydratase/phosphate acetyltransferase [Roseisalinus antarcticus]SLN37219.1 Phosphate acetyltransferase [Roseisalinus antarcticus]